jgi:hypothetical protein
VGWFSTGNGDGVTNYTLGTVNETPQSWEMGILTHSISFVNETYMVKALNLKKWIV